MLTGDYLAEVTMLILGKARAKDPTKGYAASFLHHLDAALEHLVANRIRLVVNAGGLNPAGLATATRELAARRGHELRVAHIDGDDVFDRLDALPPAGHTLRASHQRRAAVVLAPPAADRQRLPRRLRHRPRPRARRRHRHHRPRRRRVAGRRRRRVVVGMDRSRPRRARRGGRAPATSSSAAPQATGGNFSGFRDVADLDDPGFPIAEIAADGSSVITKHAGTGGAVTEDTVKAQLLYEIGEPAYLNPDVVAHLDTAEVTDLGDDRVEIRSVRGSAPPPTTKVAITAVGGWQNSMLLALTAPDADAKAALVERSVRRYAASVEGIDAIAVQRIGRAQNDPDTQNAGTELLRIAVQGTQAAAGRTFSSHLVGVALSSYPGLYALDPPQPGSAFGVYWPALLDQTALDHTVHHHDGTTEVIATTPAARAASAAPAPATPTGRPAWTDELVEVALSEIVHTRSGDKGGDANVGVWVRDRHAWPWLESTLTVDELQRLLPETRELPVERYELPNLGAVNFVIRGLLGAGATSSLRLDAQAKALGEWLRARTIKVPRGLIEPPHSGEGL